MKALDQKLKKTQIEMDTSKKRIAKERKALKKQINAGLKESLQLQNLQKELDIKNKELHYMHATMKNVATFSRKEKKHLQKENARLQKKLYSQQEKILSLQRLHEEASVLNLSRCASDEKELTTLRRKVVELKRLEAVFISKVAREKKNICNLEKENSRLLAEQVVARGGRKVSDEKIETLAKKLIDLKKLFKKTDEKRRDLINDAKITKGIFSEMEKEYISLIIENNVRESRKVKVQYEFDLHREKVDSFVVEGTPNSASLCSRHQHTPPKNPNTNPGSPAAKKPIAQSREKN